VDFCFKYQQYPLLLVLYDLNYKFRRQINQILNIKTLKKSLSNLNSMIFLRYDNNSYKRRLIKRNLPDINVYKNILFHREDLISYRLYDFALFVKLYYHCPNPDITLMDFNLIYDNILETYDDFDHNVPLFKYKGMTILYNSREETYLTETPKRSFKFLGLIFDL